ncbi:MAG: NAD-dependent epimerase/dehydratase family protein [Bacteroidia bacterium]
MNIKADIEHIVTHTQAVWKEITGKTIFITGGTGFFGKWMLESFLYANSALSLNAKILVLSRNPDLFLSKYPSFKNEAFSFIKGDVRDFQFPEQEIDYIIHAATEANVKLNIEQPLLMFDTIVVGTKHILELARIKNVKAILHTSSGAVYGKQPHDLTHITEDFKGSPDIYSANAAYSEGKRVAEMLCNFYYREYGVNSKIARGFTFIGPYLPLDGDFAIGNFIQNLLAGDNIKVNGDGTPYRSYLYASDLSIWLWNILMFGKPCRPYNVGSDEGITIKELARLVAANSDKEIKVEIAMPTTNAAPLRYVPSVKRAKEELGMKIYINLAEAIKKTIKLN